MIATVAAPRPAPTEVVDLVRHLTALSDDLTSAQRQLAEAKRAHVDVRQAADLAAARAYLRSSGTVDERKATVTLETAAERVQAEAAEVEVDLWRQHLRNVETKIGVYRSLLSSQREQMHAFGGGA